MNIEKSSRLWTFAIRMAIEDAETKAYKKVNEWSRRIEALHKSWIGQYKQLCSTPPKEIRWAQPKTWDKCLVHINELLSKKGRSSWERRYDALRRTWEDRGERAKGREEKEGKEMDQRIKIEKVGAQWFRDQLKKQNYKCALSGRELRPDNTAMDHIMPLSRGGHHTQDNAQLLDAEVNRAKGSMTDEEFRRMCEEVTVGGGLL
jgi:5-methylcytosine-specific restriction endonuclease McrA